VIEVDSQWNVLKTFTAVKAPRHLSFYTNGRVLVADTVNHRVLLLNSDLEQQTVLIDAHSHAQMWWPMRLCFNEPTLQLYVAHEAESSTEYFVSVFRLPRATSSPPVTSPRKITPPVIPSFLHRLHTWSILLCRWRRIIECVDVTVVLWWY